MTFMSRTVKPAQDEDRAAGMFPARRTRSEGAVPAPALVRGEDLRAGQIGLEGERDLVRLHRQHGLEWASRSPSDSRSTGRYRPESQSRCMALRAVWSLRLRQIMSVVPSSWAAWWVFRSNQFVTVVILIIGAKLGTTISA